MKKAREPEVQARQEEAKPSILTRPVRVTMESRLPGSKEVNSSVTECERAVVLTEKVTGAIRSAKDPDNFREKREGGVEIAGFNRPEDAVNLMLSSVVAAVHMMSGEDERRYEANFLTALQVLLDWSGISKENLTLQVSTGLLERRHEVIEADRKAAAAAAAEA